jgi:DNA polymerase-1
MMAPLYLVDGYNLIYRSYFAFIRRPLHNPEGRNSSAVFGFFRSLFQLLRLKKPEYLVVVQDSRTPTFRHEQYVRYKANRGAAPEELHDQVPVIEEILTALGIRTLRRDGFEADDLIATLALKCREEGRPCYILSGDKDILQIVGDGIYVLGGRDEGEPLAEWGREEIYRQRGVYPEQIQDYLALVGDSSDNVPGVKGIGEKTAVKLLAEHGSLDAIYRNIDAVKPESVRQKLLAGREGSCLSRELVRLRTDVPTELDLESFRLKPLNAEAAIPLFARQGMRTLVEELGGSIEKELDLETTRPEGYHAVLDEPTLDGWIEAIRRRRLFALDIETDSLDEIACRPIGISLAVTEGSACYIPLKAGGQPVLPEEVVRARLKPVLEDPDIRVVGQNLKFDYKVLKRWGIELRGLHFDTMIAAWVLDSEQLVYGLDSLAMKFLSYKVTTYEEAVGKDKQLTLADIDLSRATAYSAEDADIALRLYRKFDGELKGAGLDRVFYRLEMPLVQVLADMELAGIRIDPGQLACYSVELDKEMDAISREIYTLCGREFNLNSTQQLQEVLFKERKLTPIKKTKTGYSTDTSVLEELALEDEVPARLLRYRFIAKLKSTYINALPEMCHPADGRLHTHFIQTGTATGRLSSKFPNLQNIPVREEEGRRIRSAFIPEPGWRFLSADYSQIELAVLASLSGDPMLQEAFRQGRDIHTQTASLLFGVPTGEVSPSQRQVGKTINFGVIYGMSAFRLARDLRIGREVAQKFINRYFQRYARVEEFIRSIVRDAEQKGYVETITGRRRRILNITSRNHAEKAAAERAAVNSVIQGSAADIVKRAMLEVVGRLREEGMSARLLLQVHDELIFEVTEAEQEKAARIIRAEMDRIGNLAVPLTVKVEVGASWGVIH